MIHIKKYYNQPPFHLSQPTIQKQVQKALQNKDGSLVKGYNHKDIKNKLETIYNQKCGYCESKVAHAASLQVEHYRPKKKIDPKDEKLPNDGYYWLAAEWSNLLLSCPACNQKGAKGNRFPINGKRIIDHLSFLTNGALDSQKCLPNVLPLKDEEPLLLNPELCRNPEVHFEYNSDGKVSSKTNEGKITIEVCKLNRDPLVASRKEVIDQVIEKIEIVLVSIPQNSNYQIVKNSFKKIFDWLKSSSVKPQEEYMLLRKNLTDRFSDIVLSGIDPRFKKIVDSAFIAYQNGTL